MPWPEPTPLLPPGPAALKNLPPVGSGFLDLRLPWLTLTQGGSEPGYLTRLGPITPAKPGIWLSLPLPTKPSNGELSLLTAAARLMAVARIRSRRSPAGPARAGPRKSTSSPPERGQRIPAAFSVPSP